MRFRDGSAVVPLLVAEPSADPLSARARRESAMLVWWGTQVECVSALARLERESLLDEAGMELALGRLRQLAWGWHEVDPSDVIRETAVRLLRVHALRAADSLQLAAAFAAASGRPSSLDLVYAR